MSITPPDQTNKTENVANLDDDSVGIISPEEADNLLQQRVDVLKEEGWRVVQWTVYMVRLRQGDCIRDVMVDLEGNLTEEEKPAIESAAELGRLIAWLILLAALALSLTLASVLGFL